MSQRKYYAQKTLILESEQIEIKCEQWAPPSTYVQFNVVPAVVVPLATPTLLSPITPVILKNDEWTVNPLNAAQLIRGFPIIGPITYKFNVQIITEPYAAAANHLTLEAHLIRSAVDTEIFGMDLIADSTGIGSTYNIGKTFAFIYEFLFGDIIQFRLNPQAGTATILANTLITISQ
jgi:hypothetical protein